MTDLTREQIEELLDSPLKDTKLAYSDEGYGVIYIAPTENEDSAVCVPVRDKNMGWHKANPEVYMALVDRFNAAPDLARQLLATMTERDEAQAAQALVVERACLAVSEQADWPEDEHGRTEQPELFARVINAICSLADPTGVKLLAELRAERDLLRADRDSAARMWQASEQEREAAVERAREASQMLAIETNHAAQAEAERDRLRADYAGQVQDLIAQQTEITDLRAQLAEAQKREAGTDEATAFDRADWFWRTMDPDDCGDSPEEAINRAMVGRFCVCEIASSYSGPTRYGFIAPVLDPERDDEEFVHFATQQEAIDAAKARAALSAAPTGEESNG